MQIDFHHAVTYVTARLAGFAHEEADIIAYSAQYVDDATANGAICFDNKAMYQRVSSAHQTIDPENMNDIENHVVWLPFHFLPGNGNQPAETSLNDLGGKFINKIVCMPDSPVAQEMVGAAIAYRSDEQGYDNNRLHRLGVTMHVYADTWAHYGFAGVLNNINEVDDAEEIGVPSGVFPKGPAAFLTHILDDVIPPLGHGRANIFPDMPFLSWKYKNGADKTVQRNNTDLFCNAANAMCRAMQRHRKVAETGITKNDEMAIRNLFTQLKTKDEAERHGAWLKAIKTPGTFSFAPEQVSYAADGRYSWKAQALGTSSDMPVYSYKESFLNSNWKRFHDAIQLHRLTLLHDILPKYGICAG